MFRIAIVGDLSLQDPARLDKAMAAACADSCDMVVQVGDMHPGYSVVLKYAAQKTVKAIPGNHDTSWDSQLGWQRQWNLSNGECHMVGLDNSHDTFNQKNWDALAAVPEDGLPVIVFVHKPLTTIILPDGSESGHIMGEGGPTPSADASRLMTAFQNRDVLFVHGHYHGWTLMKTKYGDCLIEGRGGAAPQLGYSLITIRSAGIVLHSINL